MDAARPAQFELRLAEVIAALSLATDLGMGQPLEFALRSCILAVRLGDALGWNDEQLREAYYQALMRYIGCNAETHMMAALYGDELLLRKEIALVDNANNIEVLSVIIRRIRQANQGASLVDVTKAIVRGIAESPEHVVKAFSSHCEVAQRLATRLGFSGRIVEALGQLYERWDGKGLPNHVKGEHVAPSVLLVTLVQDVVLFYQLSGIDAALNIARERRGTAYEPHMVDVFCTHAAQLLRGFDDELVWDRVLEIEPSQRVYLTSDQFDQACEAMADFADLKSPYTGGHSRAVASLVSTAADLCGLPPSDVLTLRRAGLLHDLGKVGITAGIWTKQGKLTDREWEQVRLHPYYTERVLKGSPALSLIGNLASLHHERLDGSGYHRGVIGAMLSPSARLLSVANAYQALTETRPHRDAISPDQAADHLRQQVRGGQLDSEAVNAVLNAAGHSIPHPRRDLTAGLSERELEVLRLVARGNSMKQIAQLLVISPKTVDNHIQRIYEKIGVSTRAAATLFAIERNLLS